MQNHDDIIEAVSQWVEAVVVGLNLCPFAKRELAKNRVRYTLTTASTEAELLDALQAELDLLNTTPAIETTLLVHPYVLQDFSDYNEFLDRADLLLVQLGFEGVYQVASFHPDYQFAGTLPDDAENYTNRSPCALLHLIRESSLEKVIATCPDPDQIPERNIALLKRLGRDKMQAMLRACHNKAAK